MLNLMRKHAGSWMIKFILGAVILAFIPFGYGIYQDRRDAEVANVNGESILYDDFNRVYNNLIVQMRQNFGDSLNEDMIKMLQLKQQAIDRLIEEKLLYVASAKMSGGKADAMDNDQRYIISDRTQILIWSLDPSCCGNPMISDLQHP